MRSAPGEILDFTAVFERNPPFTLAPDHSRLAPTIWGVRYTISCSASGFFS